jgi:hypothetical protein
MQPLALLVLTMPMFAPCAATTALTGAYIEARTCDIWTAPCFANAEINLAGKHAIMGWNVERGSFQGVDLQGLSVVAVVASTDTLGFPQAGPSKAVVFVDKDATQRQKDALVRLAKNRAGNLLDHVALVEPAAIEIHVCDCSGGTCGSLRVGEIARIETRCVDVTHDKACGNESALYPPLALGTKVQPAVAVEHRFDGKMFNQTWKEADRRGAYVGKFEIR